MALIKNFIITFGLMLVSTQADSNGWDMFGKQSEMKGYNIVDVGEVTQLIPPLNTRWNIEVFKINEYCLSISDYVAYLGHGTAALLLVNEKRNIRLAILRAKTTSVKAEVHSTRIIKCPSTNIIIQ